MTRRTQFWNLSSLFIIQGAFFSFWDPSASMWLCCNLEGEPRGLRRINQRRRHRRAPWSNSELGSVVFVRPGRCFYSKGGHRTELGRFLCGKDVFAPLPTVLGQAVGGWPWCCGVCLMLPLIPADWLWKMKYTVRAVGHWALLQMDINVPHTKHLNSMYWQFVMSVLWPLTFSLHSHWAGEAVPKWKVGAPAWQVEAGRVVLIVWLNHYGQAVGLEDVRLPILFLLLQTETCVLNVSSRRDSRFCTLTGSQAVNSRALLHIMQTGCLTLSKHRIRFY